MIKEIKVGKKTYGLIIDLADAVSGAHPATDPRWPLQLLLMKRPKGHVVPKHMHKRLPRITRQPQEALVLVRGEVRVVICDRKKKRIGTYTVKAGQCLFLADGGHEVTFTKNTIAYEFKTGPYVADKISL
ncbi:hypothetical protein A2673_03680 [Candidatus Kaiserbacteria bacterium RIFCSPHIGHO2_01_FULL_50_13]|uniref:Cupin 2 conserved barrel domain-containing protein n=1 Tax=Candidatus Kaiserbacteria bacterium RIFCSPLOWO2_01_FULL_50_24 TaxID=1798507 RepID=A0A1F6EJS2_9BACT|nr:MAG: hypothetical protein A2673_03680 [Candidatus Kaiserbacteria bacterium RIFCSPHIGHO2_01_FULL_50_13]OGG73562.1 MAG: hypothetical protein A3A34_02700 [Candidatus Kaiserbacteria bacterium RIFCSPLOWO2_01_FULL_50_24]OGG82185.1 MAG: hypothetical protein A3H74_03320 [Candidatus Kaiserbacteria bacterium RIFCSPLOWO2_02_FULL_51_13]